ncbi:MAG: hypothetical protein PHV36_12985 [Elusimicrobiales bacterium]|nr:hypothetical protein [Elusimicrobiales bacterium]
MENPSKISIDLVTEESLAVKELDGRVYFEALPLETIVPVLHGPEVNFEIRQPSAVLGVRG